MKDWDDDMEYDLEDEFEDEDLESIFEEADKLEKSNLQFEVEFYSKIAGTTQFQVLSIPDDEGYVPTEEDIRVLKTQVNAAGMDLIFRVAVGNHAVILNSNSKLIGVVPQDNPHGFMC